MEDEEDFDEFYEKFDGYKIPRRKVVKREAESEPGEILDSEEKSEKPPTEKKSKLDNSYNKSPTKHRSSPRKREKVSKQSIRDFLEEQRNRSDDADDTPTYADFKGKLQ